MNLLRMSVPRALAVVGATLAAWIALVGWAGPRLPDRMLGSARPVRGVGRYQRWLRISRWKDRLPEGGTVFGGASKRSIPHGEPGASGAPGPTSDRQARLRRFAIESRRAEVVHLAALVPVPVLAVLVPWTVALPLVLGAGAANLPCIAVTRYNRGRIERRLAARSAGVAAIR